jgi:hypothetical protein
MDKIVEKRIRKEQTCDKCNRILSTGSSVLYHNEKKVYKHKDGCPPEDVPNKNTRPNGVDLILIIETFKPLHEQIAKTGIDLLKYEDEELVKLFWIYKQYLRDKDKKIPF